MSDTRKKADLQKMLTDLFNRKRRDVNAERNRERIMRGMKEILKKSDSEGIFKIALSTQNCHT